MEMKNPLFLTPRPTHRSSAIRVIDPVQTGGLFKQGVVIQSGDRYCALSDFVESITLQASLHLHILKCIFQPADIKNACRTAQLRGYKLRGCEELVHVVRLESLGPAVELGV